MGAATRAFMGISAAPAGPVMIITAAPSKKVLFFIIASEESKKSKFRWVNVAGPPLDSCHRQGTIAGKQSVLSRWGCDKSPLRTRRRQSARKFRAAPPHPLPPGGLEGVSSHRLV